jgi:hypothetical protein
MAEAPKEFPNWKLGEKKALKEAEPKYHEALKQLRACLGDDWQLVVDWGAIGTHTEGSQWRQDAGRYVYESFAQALVKNDLSKLDADGKDAFNKSIPIHKVTITMGPNSDTYTTSDRVTITYTDGITLKWKAEWFSYDHASDWIYNSFSTSNSSWPGEWTLAEIKNLNTSTASFEKYKAAINDKLGGGWTVNSDWASVEKGSRGNSYRNDPARHWVEAVIGGFQSKDICSQKCDNDVVEAINDKAGGAKAFNFRIGEKGDTYDQQNGRYKQTIDASGFTFTWNPEWFSYGWDGTYLTDWILNNC